jgi:hypothetical protein
LHDCFGWNYLPLQKNSSNLARIINNLQKSRFSPPQLPPSLLPVTLTLS